MNSPAAPNGFATDPRLPPPNNINPGPGFSR
jgi:hypothetical protein